MTTGTAWVLFLENAKPWKRCSPTNLDYHLSSPICGPIAQADVPDKTLQQHLSRSVETDADLSCSEGVDSKLPHQDRHLQSSLT